MDDGCALAERPILCMRSNVPAPSTPTRGAAITQLRAAAQPFVPHFAAPGQSAAPRSRLDGEAAPAAGARPADGAEGASPAPPASAGPPASEHAQLRSDDAPAEAQSLAAVEHQQRQSALYTQQQQQPPQQPPPPPPAASQQQTVAASYAPLEPQAAAPSAPPGPAGPQRLPQQSGMPFAVPMSITGEPKLDGSAWVQQQAEPSADGDIGFNMQRTSAQPPPSWVPRQQAPVPDAIPGSGPPPGQSAVESRPPAPSFPPQQHQQPPQGAESGRDATSAPPSQPHAQPSGGGEAPLPPRWSTVAATPRVGAAAAFDICSGGSSQPGARQGPAEALKAGNTSGSGGGGGQAKRSLATHSAEVSGRGAPGGAAVLRSSSARDLAATKDRTESGMLGSPRFGCRSIWILSFMS